MRKKRRLGRTLTKTNKTGSGKGRSTGKLKYNQMFVYTEQHFPLSFALKTTDEEENFFYYILKICQLFYGHFYLFEKLILN